MATIDSVLNVAIPLLLIVIALGFSYTKFIQPWVLPHLKKAWDYMQGTGETTTTKYSKEIVYG